MWVTRAAGLLLALSFAGAAAAQTTPQVRLSLTYDGFRQGAGTYCFRLSNLAPIQTLAEVRRVAGNPRISIGQYDLAPAPAGGRTVVAVEAPPLPSGGNFTLQAFSLSPEVRTFGTATTGAPLTCTLLPPIIIPPPVVVPPPVEPPPAVLPPTSPDPAPPAMVEPPPIEGAQRQLTRLQGGAFFARGYQISDQIAFGFTRDAFQVEPEKRWNVWGTPRGIGLQDTRSGVTANGAFIDLTLGADYRLSPDVVLGFAVGGEWLDGKVSAYAFKSRFDGVFLGPYLGWRIRPTTTFDGWVGYAKIYNYLSVPGESGEFQTNRWFVSLNLTERVSTPWLTLLPRGTLFLSRDYADGFTSSAGAAFASDRWSFNFVEGTLEMNRRFILNPDSGISLLPFLRPGLRYEMDRAVGFAIQPDGSTRSLERLYGQIRGGARLQIGPSFEASLVAGYLSIGVPGVEAWEGRALLSFLF